jgi:hypothetical protein
MRTVLRVALEGSNISGARFIFGGIALRSANAARSGRFEWSPGKLATSAKTHARRPVFLSRGDLL